MRSLVIVPTHQEADNIASLLERVRRVVPEADIIVIDDASTDGTRHIVRQVASTHGRIELIERDRKLGLGSAYRDGFALGLDRGYDLLVEIDADHSHDPSYLPLMIDIAMHGIGLVIGSRYVPGGGVIGWPRRRTWLSRWGNRYAAIVLGLAINDTTSGFRVYRAEALRSLDLSSVRADGYGFQIEMAYRAVRSGIDIVEIPIVFRDRVLGQSKMHRRIIVEAFMLVTRWGLGDLITLRRRRRSYAVPIGESDDSESVQ